MAPHYFARVFRQKGNTFNINMKKAYGHKYKRYDNERPGSKFNVGHWPNGSVNDRNQRERDDKSQHMSRKTHAYVNYETPKRFNSRQREHDDKRQHISRKTHTYENYDTPKRFNIRNEKMIEMKKTPQPTIQYVYIPVQQPMFQQTQPNFFEHHTAPHQTIPPIQQIFQPTQAQPQHQLHQQQAL